MGFGPVGEGNGGGAAGQLHAEVGELGAHAHVARGACGGVFRGIGRNLGQDCWGFKSWSPSETSISKNKGLRKQFFSEEKNQKTFVF